MAKFNSVELSKVYVELDANYRLDSDYGTEEELVAMGRDIINGGVDKMDAIVVVPTKREGFEFEAIAGFTRIVSLRTQPGWEEFNVPIRIESEKTTQAERIRINLASNIHRAPNQWSNANALEKLEKLGLKGKKLKAHLPGISDAQLSQLRQLVSCSEEVRDAGKKGLIKPTLVLSLIAANGKKQARTTNSPECDADGKAIDYQLSWEALQATIAAQIDKTGKVTAVDFSRILNVPKPLTPEQLAKVEEEKKILAAKVAAEEKLKVASGTYTKAYETVSKLIFGISPDNRKQFSDLLATIKAPTDGATADDILTRYATAQSEVEALTSTVNEWVQAQVALNAKLQSEAELAKQNEAQDKGKESLATLQSGEVVGKGIEKTPTSGEGEVIPPTVETKVESGNPVPPPMGQDRHGDEKEASLQVQTSLFVNRVKDSLHALKAGVTLRNDTVRTTTLLNLIEKLDKATSEFQGKLG